MDRVDGIVAVKVEADEDMNWSIWQNVDPPHQKFHFDYDDGYLTRYEDLDGHVLYHIWLTSRHGLVLFDREDRMLEAKRELVWSGEVDRAVFRFTGSGGMVGLFVQPDSKYWVSVDSNTATVSGVDSSSEVAAIEYKDFSSFKQDWEAVGSGRWSGQQPIAAP